MSCHHVELIIGRVVSFVDGGVGVQDVSAVVFLRTPERLGQERALVGLQLRHVHLVKKGVKLNCQS